MQSNHIRGAFHALSVLAILFGSFFPHRAINETMLVGHDMMAVAIYADYANSTQDEMTITPTICKVVCSSIWVALDDADVDALRAELNTSLGTKHAKLNLNRIVGPTERPPQSV